MVQGLEDSQMRNVLRSVREQGNKFTEQELKALFVLVKNEQLLRSVLYIVYCIMYSVQL